MLQKLKNYFENLPESNKSLIYIVWIYKIGELIGGVFVNIYIFKINEQMLDVILYNIVYLQAILIGFSGFGYLVSVWQKNMKHMYYIAYFCFILAFLSLVFLQNIAGNIYIFGLLYGLGVGSFYCALHTQELKNIKDENREKYASFLSAGKNIIDITVPILIAGIFYITGFFKNINAYNLLFCILPITYIFSFFFIKKLENYVPKKVSKKEILNFFNVKKYKFGLSFFLTIGFSNGINWFLVPLTALVILKTEVNIGIFTSIISLLSIFFVLFLGVRQTATNRLKIMGFITIFIALNFLILSANFTLAGYIFYSIMTILLHPLYSLSEYAYTMKTISHITTKDSDFFPAMISREIVLYIGRFFILIIFGLIIYFSVFSLENILKIALILQAVFRVLIWFAAYFFEKFESRE